MASTHLRFPPPMLLMSTSSLKVIDLAAPAITTVNVKKHHAHMSVNVSCKLMRKNTIFMSALSAGTTPDLADEERDDWDLCRRELYKFNFETEEVDKILGKAFGHLHSPYWGEERAKEIPKYETVNNILNYLRSLALTEEDLGKILKKFPEVLGCSLDDEVKNNVKVFEKEWSITGKSLRNLLLRNPKVLGYNVDCKGSCVAQCTRCWVRF